MEKKTLVPSPWSDLQPLTVYFNQWLLKVQNIICILHEYEDNHNFLVIEHVRDTDSNKSSDFLMNPVCIMLIYIITVLLCKFLCIVQMK